MTILAVKRLPVVHRITGGALSFIVLALLASCETIQEIAPSITDIQAPGGGSSFISSSARIDKKGWGYQDIYFSIADAPEDVFSQSAMVLQPSCQADANDASVRICTVQGQAGLGTHYFQWHIDYGQSGADTATLSRPTPPGSFEVTQAPPPPVTSDSGISPEEAGALVLFDPPDGDQCAGSFSGVSITQGSTVVPLNWRAENTDEYQNLPGEYQVVVERPSPPNCSNAPGLDLDQPNTAWGYTPENGCFVTPTNINSTATPGLSPNATFRWRVRRILEDGTFEPFTANSTFKTASPPPQPPTFLDPTPGGLVDLPDTVASQTYQIRWQLSGCEPTSFSYQLFKDDDLTASGQGACNVPGDPQGCAATVGLDREHDYRFVVDQSNQHGQIGGELEFRAE